MDPIVVQDFGEAWNDLCFYMQKFTGAPDFSDDLAWGSGHGDDYAIDPIVRQLTPERLGEAMLAADQGDTARQYEIFELVEQDPHVQSVWGKRRRAVVSKELQILPAFENNSKAEQAADLCREIVLGKEGDNGVNGWDQALWNLTDAIGKGFALSQIVWTFDAGQWIPDRLEQWPQRECILGDPLSHYAQDEDQVRVITDTNRNTGEPLKPYQWVLHEQKAWSVPLARAALFRAITWYYLFKRFLVRDWTIFCEKYGMPLRVGKYHPASDDKERRALWGAVLNMGKDAACIIPDQSTVELIERRPGGTLPYPDLVKHCKTEISTVLLGNPMTTEPGEKGARSLGEVYERSELELAEFDCKNLAATIRRDLCAPIVGFNLGWDFPIPKCEFLFEEQEDLNARSERDERLVRMGLPVGKSYFYQKYGIPEPEEGEDMIEPSKPPPFEPDDSALSEMIMLAEKKKSLNWVRLKMLLSERPKEA